MLTAWDGYARVDYLPRPGRLQVTLLTIEPTVYRRLRSGLACAFAAEDGSGPPAYVEIDIGTELTKDARVLLGDQLMAVAERLIGPEVATQEARLRLDDLAALADTWAPYRNWVLAPEPDLVSARSGSWASGLWTLFNGLGLAAAVRSFVPIDATHRSASAGDTSEWHDLDLPVELAAAAGVEPRVRWSVYKGLEIFDEVPTGIAITATGVPGAGASLLVALDDGQDDWVRLLPDPPDGPDLLAELPFVPGTAEPTLLFRTARGTE